MNRVNASDQLSQTQRHIAESETRKISLLRVDCMQHIFEIKNLEKKERYSIFYKNMLLERRDYLARKSYECIR